VFLREIDEFDGFEKNPLRFLAQSFSTDKKAVDWVLKNGKLLIQHEKKSKNANYALTIIWKRNKWIQDDGFGSFPEIWSPQRSLYVFDKSTYDALVENHIKNFTWDLEEFVIPAWIHYVDPNGKVKVGFDHKDFRFLLDDIFKVEGIDNPDTYIEFEDIVTNFWQEFIDNPEEYADRFRKMVLLRYYGIM